MSRPELVVLLGDERVAHVGDANDAHPQHRILDRGHEGENPVLGVRVVGVPDMRNALIAE